MNYKMGSYWYEKAAEGGMASAAHILGDRYCEGKSRNYKKAIYWYKKSMELGMQRAVEYQIGWCYEKLGDFEHAIEWYMKERKKALAIQHITLQNCTKLEQVYLKISKKQ